MKCSSLGLILLPLGSQCTSPSQQWGGFLYGSQIKTFQTLWHIIKSSPLHFTLDWTHWGYYCVLVEVRTVAEKCFETSVELPLEIPALLTYLLNMLSVLPTVTLLIRICATVSTPSKTKFTFCHLLWMMTQECKIIRVLWINYTWRESILKSMSPVS